MTTPNFPRSGGPQFLRRTFLPLTVAGALALGLTGCRPSAEEMRMLIRDEMEKAVKREAVTNAAVIGPYSPALRVGKFLFVSGQIALDPQTGQMRQDNIGVETKQVLDNVMAVLRSQGYDSSHVVSATVYVRDMKNYVTINTVYAGYFQEKNYPARVAVEVSALPKGANIEIAVIAFKDH
jgi:2-iminobutanoate/2-iminopropanoate deaminase